MCAATFFLSPWGQMDDELLEQMLTDEIPADWQPPQGLPRDSATWRAWRDANLVHPIDALLWPAFKPNPANWDTAAVRDLNHTDFELMVSLRAHLEHRIDAAVTTTVTHAHYFSEEDGDVGLGVAYERYDPMLQRAARDALRDLMYDGVSNKAGTVSLQLKERFQRPRPYQVAFMPGHKPRAFGHRLALTAATPSLISGHCYQGAMAVCAAYAQLRSQLSLRSRETLMQYAVDIGDRRVFAGVHYPSDNLSSWHTALKLVPHVFDATTAPDVGKFLWEAISSKSHVFREVVGRRAPYAAIVDEIERLGRSF